MRRFNGLVSLLFISLALSACAQSTLQKDLDDRTRASKAYENGRLLARPGRVTTELQPGLYHLGLETGRDGLLYIPSTYKSSAPAPLLIFLHGKNWDAQMGLDRFQAESERTGIVFLFPESRKKTWDRIGDKAFGPDTAFIDRALSLVFSSVTIDPSRIGISGFSDGASYSLSLGQTNGDFFSRVIAFSPGMSVPAAQIGRPPVFIIHGVQDDVLDIDRCSRTIVPMLVKDGYSVDYHEFQGQHLVTDEGKVLALNWFLGWNETHSFNSYRETPRD